MPTPRQLRTRSTTTLLETLESRTLLSASPLAKGVKGGTNFNLTPTAIGLPSLKSAIVAGFADTGTVSVTVLNTGTDTAKAASASVFLRTGTTDINITKAAGKLKNVAGNATGHATVKLSLPASLAAGSYSIVVKLTSNDTNSADNTVLIPGAVFTVNAGSSSLGASITSDKIPLTLDASSSKPGSIAVVFTNKGNTPSPANTSVTVQLVLHPATGADVTLIPATPYSLPALKVGASSKPITLTLPSLAAVPAGTYTPILTLTPFGFSTNNPIVLTSPLPVTITGGTVVTPPTTGLLLHGDVLHMDANSQLTGGDFLELGNFTITGSKITGSYRYVPGTLTLTYSDGGSELIDVLPIDTSATSVTFLDPVLDGNPTTVTFNTTASGAFAQSFGLGAAGTTTAYLHH